ncbi:hypothetical protein NPA13_01485 [Mycoplasma sp. 2045]|uniref:MMB_0454 family protein n=1 Tax=unclassified Mycoplasma TaxID=2683645 RepID=UPI00211CD186|nr:MULTISPECIES: hypothetical protein [unclassified Mycoplasma]MEA4134253.1 hypothetical protein [Mycoplasma sp. 2704]MEA4162588.1 hypothetical protein [Mycoplasma sp. 4404]MEA4190887.1 hypothetical protein [Mycoplasma sp. 2248]MEA4206177.1 hypothetical protein [Mycoplasma sp. 1199]MEA4276090.1 hypothetical protein [Mycoplasma sp. 21DD0573]
MNWINVSYNSNQNYIVQESAILDVVNIALSSYKNIKASNSIRLSFDDKHSNVEIYVDIKIKNQKNKEPYSTIKELITQIENGVKSLIDKKPKNVQVVLLDFY